MSCPYEDPGAIAIDAEDGNLSVTILPDPSTVDTSVAGVNFTLNYTTKDTGSATALVTRIVVVVDGMPFFPSRNALNALLHMRHRMLQK